MKAPPLGLPKDIYRPELRRTVLSAAREARPLLLTGPPGSGKTTLLRIVAEDLRAQGWQVILLDLMGAASSPERFVEAALKAVPAEAFSRQLPEAARLLDLAQSGKRQGGEAVRALFAFWTSLGETAGNPVALILDELTEIRSLSHFAGLREVDHDLFAALAARRHGTLLATSYPTLAQKLWPEATTLLAAPLTAADLLPFIDGRGVPVDAEALARASFGWPRHLRVLLDRLSTTRDLETAWVEEMAEGGRIELGCRHTYESLLLRSRGYGMSKAVLGAVAAEEGQNLKALVTRLKRTPGAIRDYLGWLLNVDALKRVGKRYFFVDGMVRSWVRLYARGTPAKPDELRGAVREILGDSASVGRPSHAAETSAHRADALMEID